MILFMEYLVFIVFSFGVCSNCDCFFVIASNLVCSDEINWVCFIQGNGKHEC